MRPPPRPPLQPLIPLRTYQLPLSTGNKPPAPLPHPTCYPTLPKLLPHVCCPAPLPPPSRPSPPTPHFRLPPTPCHSSPLPSNIVFRPFPSDPRLKPAPTAGKPPTPPTSPPTPPTPRTPARYGFQIPPPRKNCYSSSTSRLTLLPHVWGNHLTSRRLRSWTWGRGMEGCCSR